MPVANQPATLHGARTLRVDTSCLASVASKALFSASFSFSWSPKQIWDRTVWGCPPPNGSHYTTPCADVAIAPCTLWTGHPIACRGLAAPSEDVLYLVAPEQAPAQLSKMASCACQLGKPTFQLQLILAVHSKGAFLQWGRKSKSAN